MMVKEAVSVLAKAAVAKAAPSLEVEL